MKKKLNQSVEKSKEETSSIVQNEIAHLIW